MDHSSRESVKVGELDCRILTKGHFTHEPRAVTMKR